MHHKFAVIDGHMLLTGSFNWTKQASEHNRENVLATTDPASVRRYMDEFNKLWKEFKSNLI